jgi:site-specific DNA recombinase
MSMKTAAIYGRVSSQRQKDEGTIESQIHALIEYGQNKDYSIPDEWILKDEGYSGSSLVRPGLEKLRDLAAENQIDAVFIYSPDRLSRKYAYQVLLIEEIAKHGVEVIFIKSPQSDTPEDQLLLQFQGMIAEYERAQIAERCRRGKKYSAQKGSISVLTGAPYGYNYIKKTSDSDAYYKIIENEALIVQKIYKLYTEDFFSIRGISKWLNEKGISSPSGNSSWNTSTLWNILQNSAYKGSAYFGKTKKIESKKITRRSRLKGNLYPLGNSSVARPKEEWIEIPVPNIINEDIYLLAQERLKENKKFSPRRTKYPSLLQGLLVCEKCTYSLYRTSKKSSNGNKLHYYKCPGTEGYRFPNGKVCQISSIRQDYLDSIVWNQILKLLESPNLIKKEINRRIYRSKNSGTTKNKINTLNTELSRMQKSISKLLDAYQENLLELQELRERIPILRKKEKLIGSEIQSLKNAELDKEKYLSLLETMENFLSRLRESSDTLKIEEKKKIIKLLVREIIVGENTIKIKHSIPINNNFQINCSANASEKKNSLLCSRHLKAIFYPFL